MAVKNKKGSCPAKEICQNFEKNKIFDVIKKFHEEPKENQRTEINT